MNQAARRARTTRHLLACSTVIVCSWGAVAHAQLRERPMVPPSPPEARALAVSREWVELELPENPYDGAAARIPTNFRVTCPADRTFAAGIHPIAAYPRHRPESAWYSDSPDIRDAARIQVVYRITLRLPHPLAERVACTVQMDRRVARDTPPLQFLFDPDAPSGAIHVNQVAFPLRGPKTGYLSFWFGEGSVAFEGSNTFELVDTTSGKVVMTGPVVRQQQASQDAWSKSDIHSMDFTTWKAPGSYTLRVPGVGASYPFAIGGDELGHAIYTVARGLMHQRDGRHGLDSRAITHWNRPAAHVDDAIEESTGKRVELAGGHMDAGDRGKYPHNSADAAASMLAGAILFPEAVEQLGETLQLPESGNGIPDWLDETIYELDFLARLALNTSKDGTVPFFLRPKSGKYELGRGPEGEKDRVLFDATQGPYRAETLYVAGALAMACNAPLLRKYASGRVERWYQGALRSFSGFEKHAGDSSYWKDDKHSYDPWVEGPHAWSDEMLVAASNLYQVTGEPKYLRYVESELPQDIERVRHYGWSLEGPWLNALLSIARMSGPGVPEGLRERSRKAILAWADAASSHDGIAYARPYGMPLPSPVRNRVGWFFSASQTGFPLMMAYAVSGREEYRDDLIRTWSFLLGGNPRNRSYVSGLGRPDRRPRWLIHEIAHGQWQRYRRGAGEGWSELVPGIPAADLQSGEFEQFLGDDWNVPRRDAWSPPRSETPPLHRDADAWATHAEYTIDRMARGATSLLALVRDQKPSAFTEAEPPPAPGNTARAPNAPAAIPPSSRGCACGCRQSASPAAFLGRDGLAFGALLMASIRRRLAKRESKHRHPSRDEIPSSGTCPMDSLH